MCRSVPVRPQRFTGYTPMYIPMLHPLDTGLQDIQRALFIKDEISYFDGFQGYILTPKM